MVLNLHPRVSSIQKRRGQNGRIGNPLCQSGDIDIAYQVHGSGPIDLIWVIGYVNNLELHYEMPEVARFVSRLSSFCRLIRLDRRGTGLSERSVDPATTLEQRVDDVRAVMDAAGSDGAALFGVSEGGLMSIMLATTHPERVSALVLYSSFAAHPMLSATPEEINERLAAMV